MRFQTLGFLVLLAWFSVAGAPPSSPKPATLPPPTPLKPAAPPKTTLPAAGEIQLTPPSRDQLFRPESEATLRERLVREAQQRKAKLEFPADTSYTPKEIPRIRPPQATTVVPYVVCYQPLYFEDKNSERYGWHIPLVQPLISTGKFYVDTLLLPYNMGVLLPWQRECNSGYPLPGDPVPYRIYLPPWSWKGAALEAGAVTGGFAAFH